MSSSPSLLVVEDDPQIARALKRALRMAGFDCDTLISVGDMSLASSFPNEGPNPPGYPIAIVDIHLPDGNGLDVFERLQAEGKVGEGVFFSATTSEDEKQRAAQSGTFVAKTEGIGAAVSAAVKLYKVVN